MTHRSDVISLEVGMTSQCVRQCIARGIHEAYPVTNGGIEKVIGVVYLKDLVLTLESADFSLRSIMHQPVYFYESMSVYRALEQMRQKRISQAFVCDEFGELQGIITLHDILEGLVGTLDEQNEEPSIIEREGGNGWLIDGQCPMHEFLAHFDREDLFEDKQGYTTIAGLLIEQMNHIPISGESIEWNGIHIEVVDMDGARIDKVLVMRAPSK